MKKYESVFIKHTDFKKMLKKLQKYPDYKRILSEKKLTLIKDYGTTAKKEIKRCRRKFNKDKSIERFCDKNNINVKTFYGYIRQYEKKGLNVYIPLKSATCSGAFRPPIPVNSATLKSARSDGCFFTTLISSC